MFHKPAEIAPTILAHSTAYNRTVSCFCWLMTHIRNNMADEQLEVLLLTNLEERTCEAAYLQTAVE
jgi:hypothetical protein